MTASGTAAKEFYRMWSYPSRFVWEDAPMSSSTSLIIALVTYVAVIAFLKEVVMKNRQPFKLSKTIILHNSILVVASFVMMVGTGGGIIWEMLFSNGFDGVWDLFCDPEQKFKRGVVPFHFWGYVFYISKYYEFLDTLFIVLKKRELTLLHIYHHLLTTFLTWAGIESATSNQWTALCANTFVHCLMYFYYILAALGHKVWWKKYLTTLQMAQFFLNLFFLMLWLVFNWQNQPVGCSGQMWAWWACLIGNVSFYVLFQMFYNNTYAPKQEPKAPLAAGQQTASTKKKQ